jgi:hypothetical protein
MEDNIENLQDELERARRNLRQTVVEVNHKVERKVEQVSTNLQPEVLIEQHLPLAAGLVCAAGFTTGVGEGRPIVVATLVLGGLIGLVRDAVYDPGVRDQVERD